MSQASVAPAERYPVDVCYMVADLKYNARQGVKICEVQQASLSLFNGDTYRELPEEQSIHKQLLRTLSTYNPSGWVVNEGLTDKKLVATLASSPTWQKPADLPGLVSDQDFMQRAKQAPADVHDLASYQGFLYINWSQLAPIYDFETRFPGVVVLDRASFPFWIDKYRMTRLFNEDEVLSRFKPNWGNYPKHYTKKLAEQIVSELQCDTFVIKPRAQFMGKGVIIVQKQDLDEVLRFVITKKGKLAAREDPAYQAWLHDDYDSFVVEEFVTSDPIRLPHLGNKRYQPTMRVAFLLTYHQRKHDVHFLGSYWKTPELSIDEPGDFMHKNKDICEPPFYRAVEPKTMQAVQEQLRVALPLLHSKMLQFQPGPHEDFYTTAKDGNVKLIFQQV